MSNFKFTREGLLDERNLFDIYRISRATPVSPFNLITTICLFFILLVYVCSTPDIRIVLGQVRSLTGDALSLTSSILGFLVAGFAIFLTPSRPEIFEIMAKHEYEETGFSYLKYNLSIFILVFVHYLAFFVFCFLIRLFCGTGGFAHTFINALPIALETKTTLVSLGVSAAFLVVGTWFFYVIMLLKSFIFNLYHVVMTAIALQMKDE